MTADCDVVIDRVRARRGDGGRGAHRRRLVGDRAGEGPEPPDRPRCAPRAAAPLRQRRDRPDAAPPARARPACWSPAPTGAREADGDRLFTGEVNNLPSTVGGGGVHADAKLAPLPRGGLPPPHRAGTRSRAPTCEDWPIAYDDLEPHYAAVEAAFGVAGRGRHQPVRGLAQHAVPHAPGRRHAHGAGDRRPPPSGPGCTPTGPRPGSTASPTTAGRRASTAGSAAATAARSTPRATRSPPCSAPCARAGAEIRPEAYATEIVLDAIGSAGHGRPLPRPDAGTPTRRCVRCPPAGRWSWPPAPFETPRLLLRNGLGGDLVGRYLTYHFQTFTLGIFPEDTGGERGRSVTHLHDDLMIDTPELRAAARRRRPAVAAGRGGRARRRRRAPSTRRPPTRPAPAHLTSMADSAPAPAPVGLHRCRARTCPRPPTASTSTRRSAMRGGSPPAGSPTRPHRHELAASAHAGRPPRGGACSTPAPRPSFSATSPPQGDLDLHAVANPLGMAPASRHVMGTARMGDRPGHVGGLARAAAVGRRQRAGLRLVGVRDLRRATTPPSPSPPSPTGRPRSWPGVPPELMRLVSCSAVVRGRRSAPGTAGTGHRPPRSRRPAVRPCDPSGPTGWRPRRRSPGPPCSGPGTPLPGRRPRGWRRRPPPGPVQSASACIHASDRVPPPVATMRRGSKPDLRARSRWWRTTKPLDSCAAASRCDGPCWRPRSCSEARRSRRCSGVRSPRRYGSQTGRSVGANAAGSAPGAMPSQRWTCSRNSPPALLGPPTMPRPDTPCGTDHRPGAASGSGAMAQVMSVVPHSTSTSPTWVAPDTSCSAMASTVPPPTTAPAPGRPLPIRPAGSDAGQDLGELGDRRAGRLRQRRVPTGQVEQRVGGHGGVPVDGSPRRTTCGWPPPAPASTRRASGVAAACHPRKANSSPPSPGKVGSSWSWAPRRSPYNKPGSGGDAIGTDRSQRRHHGRDLDGGDLETGRHLGQGVDHVGSPRLLDLVLEHAISVHDEPVGEARPGQHRSVLVGGNPLHRGGADVDADRDRGPSGRHF